MNTDLEIGIKKNCKLPWKLRYTYLGFSCNASDIHQPSVPFPVFSCEQGNKNR